MTPTIAEPRRSALLLVDLQEAFFENPVLAGARTELLASVDRLAIGARDAGVPIFLISTEHSRDRSTWTLAMLDAGEGFLFHGDPGTEVVHELDTAGMTRLEKTRDSAWLGTDLPLRLRTLGVEQIAIAGVSTHACIAHTARDAYAHNVRAVIVGDAVADERQEHERAVLELIVEDGQAEVLEVSALLAGWSRGA